MKLVTEGTGLASKRAEKTTDCDKKMGQSTTPRGYTLRVRGPSKKTTDGSRQGHVVTRKKKGGGLH